MQRILRCALALIFFNIAPTAKATDTAATSTYLVDRATCATGSVNWITHTLPQQCLRTSWPASTIANITNDSSRTPSTQHSDAGSTAGSIAPSLSHHLPTPSGSHGSDSSSNVSHTASPDLGSSSDGVSVPLPTSNSTPEDTTVEEADADSLLHNANFLSFEEWRKQKLGEAGQSPEALAGARGSLASGTERQRPGAALDTLGEDSEIDLDFSGFGGTSQDTRRIPQPSEVKESNASDSESNNVASSGPSGARSKDAGRTYKERFNYASFDCAANVLKTNSRCKSSSSVLVENKDSYMLNECSMDNKFLIVELCEYIQIDTVVLANFEFFSSMFRTFRVSVSDRYPVKIDKWQELGTYEARNTREIQAFLIENPLIWAKYIRIEFLTHYGNEFYCPLSLLRVHGTTMMEDYRHQEELARGEVDLPDEELEVASEVIAVPAVSSHLGGPEAFITPVTKAAVATPESDSGTGQEQDLYADSRQANGDSSSSHLVSTPQCELSSEPCSTSDHSAFLPPSVDTENSCPTYPHSSVTALAPTDEVSGGAQSRHSGVVPTTSPSDPATSDKTLTSDLMQFNASSLTTTSTVPDSLRAPSIVTSKPDTHSGLKSHESSLSKLDVPSTGGLVEATSQKQHAAHISSHPGSVVADIPSSVNHQNTTYTSTQGTSMPPAPTQPATQESFFKTLSKRLSLLEANASLSLQYIESQSLLLRDAFSAVEKRQVQKTASFLATLNETVLKELAAARGDYDQLWQSTVLELAGQRDEGRREREILNDRVRLLAEEVVGQKRLMAVQTTVLLVVLGLVVFTKVAPGQVGEAGTSMGVGDIRILQGMQALMQRGRSGKRITSKRPSSAGTDDDGRGHAQSRARWGWESPLLGSPVTTRPTTSHGMDETHEDAWNDLLAFVDENVRPRQTTRSTSYLNKKPLPPAPRSDITPLRPDMDASEGKTDLLTPDTPLMHRHLEGGGLGSSQKQGMLGVSGRMPLDRRSSNIRAAKSAPTTPQVEPSSMFGDNADDTPTDMSEASGASGASDGADSIGLGIDI